MSNIQYDVVAQWNDKKKEACEAPTLARCNECWLAWFLFVIAMLITLFLIYRYQQQRKLHRFLDILKEHCNIDEVTAMGWLKQHHP